MRLSSALLVPVLVFVGASCALRPRYTDFVTAKTVGPESPPLVLTSKDGAPLANVRVEMGEGKSRYTVTTKADGSFVLPVDKKYLGEDPVLVIALPAGTDGYALVVAPVPAPEVLQAPAAVPAAPATPATPEKG